MADLAPVLVAIASTLGGLAALIRALPYLRRLGLGDGRDCARDKAELRVEADVWQEKFNIANGQVGTVTAERDKALGDLTTALLNLDFARRSGSECRQELDDLRSEIRARARRPRS